MKLISWNVNGIRACLKKGLTDFVAEQKPDFLCLQETKARQEQVELPAVFNAYRAYWNSAQKPGYSGTVIFTQQEPLKVILGIDQEKHDQEGRVVTLEFEAFYLVNVYTPNAQDGLRRLKYRCEWDEAFLGFIQMLERQGKPVVVCGDLNVAYQEIDLARPKQNHFNPGFSDEERAGFGDLLEKNWKDTFREAFPNKTQAYSWWSYRVAARERNIGWRIDYVLVSSKLLKQTSNPFILAETRGSDHCPVGCYLDI